jgi:hypothetical protein
MIELVDDHGDEWLLGAAEIHVDGDDGSAYAAPSLIVHYVREHGYRPPRQFRAAVLQCARFYGFPPPRPAR